MIYFAQITFLLQLERYENLKQLAQKQGAVLNQQAEKLHWELKADSEKMSFDLRRKKEVEVMTSLLTLSDLNVEEV